MLSAESVSFGYGPAGDLALRGADLRVARGDGVAIVGASGSGKTTLLYCLAGVLVPTAGTVRFDGTDLGSLSTEGRARIRLQHMGFVFQNAELVAELSLRENVELPLRAMGERNARTRAMQAMEQLGIHDLAGRLPGQVSGGQAQRCAVARALVHRPAVVLADEPTGSLDSTTGAVALQVLTSVCREAGAALVVVTHSEEVAAALPRRVRVTDGRCTEVGHDQDGG